jgi:hypothetical protein
VASKKQKTDGNCPSIIFEENKEASVLDYTNAKKILVMRGFTGYSFDPLTGKFQ